MVLCTSPPWYTADLIALAACINPSPPPLPTNLQRITTPLNLEAWELWLSTHPDQEYASYLLEGIANGFRIGFSHIIHSCTPARRNHPSADKHPSVISEGLATEVQKGRLISPLNPADYPYVQTSSLGAVPKKHSDKWRLILDLSHPDGSSVNDGISKSICSLTYMKVQDAVRQILKLGQGCFLAKIDIDSAFRNVPVHPHDRHLLGMIWNQQLYVDTVLPFGLRSAGGGGGGLCPLGRVGRTCLPHYPPSVFTALACMIVVTLQLGPCQPGLDYSPLSRLPTFLSIYWYLCMWGLKLAPADKHAIDWEETTVLDHGRGQELLVKEVLHIQMTPSEEHFNRDGALEVPGYWTAVMRRQKGGTILTDL